MTRRRIRRLRADAERAWSNGIYFEAGYQTPAPAAGPLRIAFDAGRKSAREKQYYGLPLDVWTQVLADWMSRL